MHGQRGGEKETHTQRKKSDSREREDTVTYTISFENYCFGESLLLILYVKFVNICLANESITKYSYNIHNN